MKRFDVCRAHGAGVAGRERLVVVLQHEQLAELATVVVAPLFAPSDLPKIGRLRPVVVVGGQSLVAAMDRLVSIPVKQLSSPLHNLEHHRFELVGALDILFSGI